MTEAGEDDLPRKEMDKSEILRSGVLRWSATAAASAVVRWPVPVDVAPFDGAALLPRRAFDGSFPFEDAVGGQSPGAPMLGEATGEVGRFAQVAQLTGRSANPVGAGPRGRRSTAGAAPFVGASGGGCGHADRFHSWVGGTVDVRCQPWQRGQR